MDSVVAMGTAKWCPNDLSLSYHPSSLPSHCSTPSSAYLLPSSVPNWEGVITPRLATLPHGNWYFKGKKRVSLGAAVLDPADEGELSLRKNVS